MTTYQLQKASVRAFIDGISNQNTVIWFRVADPKLIDPASVTDMNSLQDQIYNAGPPSRELLNKVAQAIEPAGASLLVSKDTWRTIGIFGTNDSLGQIQGIHITDFNTGMTYIAGGAIGYGAVFFAVATVPEPASPVLFGIGVVLTTIGASILVGVGINELRDDPKPPAQPTSSLDEFPDDTVGAPPDDIQAAVDAGGDYADFIVLAPTVELPVNPPDDGGDGGLGGGAGGLGGDGDLGWA